MTERRYSDEETTAIFERAADARALERRPTGTADGLTLAELQEIGREVGIPADSVARAAKELDGLARPTRRRFLGLPIGVGRSVDLGRRLSEEEWERLVVDLRETFDARGSVQAHGSFRQWTNGNLQVLLEPTSTGHRLRLRTVRGSSRRFMSVGLGFLGTAVAMFGVAAITGSGADPGAVNVLSLMGLGFFGAGAVRLPGWARLRQRQMDGVVERVLAAAPVATKLPPGESDAS